MDHEDIIVQGFYLGNKYNNTGRISLLKIPIHIWSSNWQEQLGKMQADIGLGSNAKVNLFFIVL